MKKPIAVLVVALLCASLAVAQRHSPQGGTITNVIAGSGATGGGSAGPVTVNVGCAVSGGLACTADAVGMKTTCSSTQVLAWDGDSWECAAPGATYTAGDGLTLTGNDFDVNPGAGVTITGDALTLNIAGASCGASEAVTAIGATGTGTCSTVGDITAVTAGTGMTGGASSGAATVTLNLSTQDCSAGSFFDSNTATGVFTCVAEVGDISNVSVTSPISGGGASGSVTVGLTGCGASDEYLWRWDDDTSAWVCSADVISVAFPDGGGMTHSGDPSQQGADVSVAIRDDCDEGQLLEWTDLDGEGGGTDFGWECADDDTGGGGISGLTTNRLSKATSSTTIGDSSVTDDGTDVITSLNWYAGLNTGTDAKTFSIGRDVNLTTNTQNGHKIIAFSDGNVYQDTKTHSGGNLTMRIGEGTAQGNTNTWGIVDATLGAVSFPGGGVTLGNSTSDPHVLNGTLNANSTAGSTGQVLKVNGSSLPAWGTDEGAASEQQTSSTGTLNDFSLTASVTSLVFTGTTITVNGITGGAAGRCIAIINSGGAAMQLSHEAGGSTAANRIATHGGNNYILSTGANVKACWDGSDSRWRLNEGSLVGALTATAASTFQSSIAVTSFIGTNDDIAGDSASKIQWSSTSAFSGGKDTGIARASAGVVEINNGSAGTLRDLSLRDLTSTGTTTFTGTSHVLGQASGTIHVTAKDTSNRPTLSSCGSGAALVGNDHAMKLTTGSGPASCTVTWNTAYGSNYSCVVTARDGTFRAYTLSTNQLQFTTVSASAIYDIACWDH